MDFDTYQDSNSEGMVVWVKSDDGSVSKHVFYWSPVLHIAGNLDDIDALEVKLKEMEYQTLFARNFQDRRDSKVMKQTEFQKF